MGIPERYISESWRRCFQERVYNVSKKKFISWYPCWVDFDVQNNIQPGEYSMGGGIDRYGYESGSRVVNVNWNDGKWNVNDWNRENRWNAGNRVFSPENDRFLLAKHREFSFSQSPFSIRRFASLFPATHQRAHCIFYHRICGVPRLSASRISRHQPP